MAAYTRVLYFLFIFWWGAQKMEMDLRSGKNMPGARCRKVSVFALLNNAFAAGRCRMSDSAAHKAHGAVIADAMGRV